VISICCVKLVAGRVSAQVLSLNVLS